MICSNCKTETLKISILFSTNSPPVEMCSNCSPKNMKSNTIVYVKGSCGGNWDRKGKRTAAHEADIRRRRLAPDGKTVYRDYGRKYFT